MILYTWLGIDYHNSAFEYVRNHTCCLSNWMKYNLPDGLWLCSFLLFMEGIWGKEKYWKWLFCVLIIAFAFIIEIMQYNGLFPGTGDFWDLISYISAFLLFLLFIKLKQMYYEKNT